MRKDFKTRYELILDRIKQSPCTYSEIKDYLLNSNEFQRIGMTSYSIRTLQRDLKEIESLYDVVVNNRRCDPRYYIVEDPYK